MSVYTPRHMHPSCVAPPLKPEVLWLRRFAFLSIIAIVVVLFTMLNAGKSHADTYPCPYGTICDYSSGESGWVPPPSTSPVETTTPPETVYPTETTQPPTSTTVVTTPPGTSTPAPTTSAVVTTPPDTSSSTPSETASSSSATPLKTPDQTTQNVTPSVSKTPTKELANTGFKVSPYTLVFIAGVLIIAGCFLLLKDKRYH